LIQKLDCLDYRESMDYQVARVPKAVVDFQEVMALMEVLDLLERLAKQVLQEPVEKMPLATWLTILELWLAISFRIRTTFTR
jgi:hypothetical protein